MNRLLNFVLIFTGPFVVAFGLLLFVDRETLETARSQRHGPRPTRRITWTSPRILARRAATSARSIVWAAQDRMQGTVQACRPSRLRGGTR